jgi:hypothetical protein
LVTECYNKFVCYTNENLEYIEKKLARNEKYNAISQKEKESFGKSSSVHFYSCPLLVDYCTTVFSLSHKAHVFDHEVMYDKFTYQLDYAFHTRFEQSYTDGKLHGECKRNIEECMFAERAIVYARQHWETFVLPPFYTTSVLMSDPTKKKDRICGGAPVQYDISVIKEQNLRFSPSSYLKDVGMTLDNHICNEIKGGCGSGMDAPHCIHCGGMLGKNICINCDIKFSEEVFLMYGDGSLLSENIQKFIITHENDIREKYGMKDTDVVLNMISQTECSENKRRYDEECEKKRNSRSYW